VLLAGSAEVPARVVKLFDTAGAKVGVAFEITRFGPGLEAELSALAGREEAGVVEGEGEAESEPAEDVSETLGTSMIHQIREMNVNQKALLATKAGRAERAILLREVSPQVLQALLANPRIETKEMLQLVKSTHVTAAILQRVAGDQRWGKNLELLTAVAKHPQTPSPLAAQLVERLRTPDLRQMSKMSGGLRENVRKAALREYLKRTGNSPG
jgi:hypothetical protein